MEQKEQFPGKSNQTVGYTIKNLSSTERTVLSVLIGWFLIQLCLFVFSDKKPSTTNFDLFWPFETGGLEFYSFLELFIYGVIPLVVFGINHILQLQSKDVQQ